MTSRRRPGRGSAWPWRFTVLGLALLGGSCAPKASPSTGTESHWLDGCSEDSDCESDRLSCVCGVCTRDCRNDDGCGERGDAICVNTESPLIVRRCEAEALAERKGICIARCGDDQDCEEGSACVSGACVPLLSVPDAAVEAPDAAPSIAADGGPSLQERLDEVASVDAATSFEVPVAMPSPDPAILGGNEDLIGTWKEVDCVPAAGFMCARIAIARGEDGAVGGALVFEGSPTNEYGALPEVTDPSVGYPVGVSVLALENLRSEAYHDVPYRILDGQWDGQRLRFRWTTLDVWQGWCEQQTSYPWIVDGFRSYQCVPQPNSEQAVIDLNKRLLCRDPQGSEPLTCDEQSYYCRCNAERLGFCFSPVCACNGSSCEVDTRDDNQVIVTLTRQAERLVGDLRYGFRVVNGAEQKRTTAFARVSP